MFRNIWDKENKAIKINEFSKDLDSSDVEEYQEALRKLYNKYGVIQFLNGDISITEYKIEFENSEKYGFSQYIFFTSITDCYLFLDSDTFQYLFESEDIDYIKITAGKIIIFKYDDRR